MLACAVIVVTGTAASLALAETLVVQGSTTFNRRVMEPHQAAIETASGQRLAVIPNKSTPGLISLVEGRSHMAMISAPLHDAVTSLRKILPNCPSDRLRAFEILSTRIAIAVHASNPVRRASMSTIRKILLGEIKNWKQLGGSDLPIRVVLAGGGGAMAVVDSVLLQGQPINLPTVIYVKTPVQLVQVIEQEPGALGFAQLSLVRQRGIPELATDYPLQTTLSFVTLGEPSPAMRSVIDATRRIAEKVM
jgi:phosphate transport system substrate-binding protein